MEAKSSVSVVVEKKEPILFVDFAHAPSPVFEVPLDRKKPSQVITDTYEMNLTTTSMSDPYLVNTDLRPTCQSKCRFHCCRGPAYVAAFLWGVTCNLAYLVSYLLCCRKTYTVLNDKELTHTFFHLWPFTGMVQTKRNEKGEEEYEYDGTVMAKTAQCTFPNFHMDGVKVRWNHVHDLISIQVGAVEYKPDDNKTSDAWSIAKLYAMYTAHYVIKTGRHAFWHFRSQEFYSILLKHFPDSNHMFRQLLDPHSEYMINVNEKVLDSSLSVLNADNTACCCWDTQVFNRATANGLFRETSRSFPSLIRGSPTPILQPFYLVIRQFIKESLVATQEKWNNDNNNNQDLESRKRFFKCLSHYMGMPENLDASKLDDLVDVLTQYMFAVTVLHSAEHYTFSKLSNEVSPMALRIPLTKQTFLPSRWWCQSRKVIGFGDAWRATMYQKMFTTWWKNRLCCGWSDTRLQTTIYDFESKTSTLKEIATRLRVQLPHAEETMQRQFPHYSLPIDEIGRSIHW